VIVPVRNRFDLLDLMLKALSQQTFGDFEVVIVDDGSSRDLAATLGDKPYGLDARCSRTEGVGAVAARQLAVSMARGRTLAFTDSDCEPEPRWLEEGVAALDEGADVVQGVTLPVRKPRVLERSLAYRGGEGLFATCNMFYRRDAFESAGGFDESASVRLGFRPDTHARRLGFGEDSLLGWRVARAGNMRVARAAVVRHAVARPPLRELFSRAWQVGAFPSLVREVPELRRTLLRRRVFLQDTSRVPLYAAATSAAFGWGAAAAVLLGWWVGSGLVKVATYWGEPMSERLAAWPVELAIDATKAAALVAGSVRTRTPVL
jgi:hypothetical protein